MLPVELYRDIVVHVKRRVDLCALALSSRLVHAEAVRGIYRSLVVIGNEDLIYSPNREPTIKLINLLEISNERRFIIDTLSIRVDYNAFKEDILPFLQTVPNLLHLALPEYIPAGIPLPINYPFRLLTFEIGRDNYPEYFIAFIVSQPQITTLILRCDIIFRFESQISNAVSFLPNLDTLFCEWYNLNLLHHRPIRRVAVAYVPNREWHPSIQDGCFPSVLSLNVSKPPLSGKLASMFPKLEYLSIVEAGQPRSIFGIVGDLACLKHLVYFQSDVTASDGTRNIASRLFASHSKLEKIEMWNEHATYVLTKDNHGNVLITEVPDIDDDEKEVDPEQWRVW